MTLTVVAASPTPGAVRGPVRRRVGLVSSVAHLSARTVRAGAREGDLLVAAGSPVLFFLCFWVPLHKRFDAAGVEYAQYLIPVILLQAGVFTAIVAAQNAGSDATDGMRARLASMPIPRSAPVIARMVAVGVRSIAAVVGGLVIGAVFGFRFRGTVLDSVFLVLLVLVFAIALSMLTDAVGSVSAHPQSVAQVLMIPQLVLVMLSTGFVPAQGFPGWIQPVVRNQPVSVLADAARGLSLGADVDTLAVIGWTLGLVAAGVTAVSMSGRGQVRR